VLRILVVVHLVEIRTHFPMKEINRSHLFLSNACELPNDLKLWELIDNQSTLHGKIAWFTLSSTSTPTGGNKDFQWFLTDSITIGRSDEIQFGSRMYINELII
jgi:hypothetical protein